MDDLSISRRRAERDAASASDERSEEGSREKGKVPNVNEREQLLSEQLDQLLGLIEKTGTVLQDNSAVIEEFGGDEDDLRLIIAKHAQLGKGMEDAVARTRARLAPHERKEPTDEEIVAFARERYGEGFSLAVKQALNPPSGAYAVHLRRSFIRTMEEA